MLTSVKARRLWCNSVKISFSFLIKEQKVDLKNLRLPGLSGLRTPSIRGDSRPYSSLPGSHAVETCPVAGGPVHSAAGSRGRPGVGTELGMPWGAVPVCGAQG